MILKFSSMTTGFDIDENSSESEEDPPSIKMEEVSNGRNSSSCDDARNSKAHEAGLTVKRRVFGGSLNKPASQNLPLSDMGLEVGYVFI